MRPVGQTGPVHDARLDYRLFAEREAGDSPVYAAWARGVAEDPAVLALLAELPPAKQQPNLVLAAARWHGARPGPYDELRGVLLERWPEVRTTVLARATQTNEVGRCATLLPVLAELAAGGPLALLEVGASAGLNLFADRYSYRWDTPRGTVRLDPPAGPSPVVLDCVVEGAAPPLPERLPEVVWRGGIDLNPLDVRDDDAMAWLETLVWPGQEERRERLAAAVHLARADPPRLVRGDLLAALPDLVAEVPGDATLAVLHSAVAAYLSEADRRRLVALMGTLCGAGRRHWLSNEGPAVLPGLDLDAFPHPPAGSVVGPAPFLLALDGRPVAWTHGHGRAVHWPSGR